MGDRNRGRPRHNHAGAASRTIVALDASIFTATVLVLQCAVIPGAAGGGDFANSVAAPFAGSAP